MIQSLILLLDLAFIAYCVWFIREVVFEVNNVPPFIRTRRAVTEEVKAIFGPLPPGSRFYDLGCGDGRMLRAIAQANPQTACIGIEMRHVPYFLARLKQWRAPLPNVTYRFGNFYSMDLSDATHLYTYLYPEVMVKLQPKLQRELAPGTRLVSLDFYFTQKEALQTVPVQAATARQLGKTFYVYAF